MQLFGRLIYSAILEGLEWTWNGCIAAQFYLDGKRYKFSQRLCSHGQLMVITVSVNRKFKESPPLLSRLTEF